jgi:hypothetical protein
MQVICLCLRRAIEKLTPICKATGKVGGTAIATKSPSLRISYPIETTPIKLGNKKIAYPSTATKKIKATNLMLSLRN